MGGLGGCIKNAVYRAVMTEKEVIKTPNEFTECPQRLAKNVHCVYLPFEEVMEEPERIERAPYKADMHILQMQNGMSPGLDCILLYRNCIRCRIIL